jgi:flagellar basal-body rod modification protein FlgD
MAVTSTSAVGAAASGNSVSGRQVQLDRDAFLKMLIVQLKNQDPLEPMEDREFIAQLAQFSALEQMQQMNKSLYEFLRASSIFQAVSLIGRVVTGRDCKTGENVSGKVESVLFEEGSPLLKVGEHSVRLEYVTKVE